jgi:hypothetical protein
MEEVKLQSQAILNGEAPQAGNLLPHPLAFNLFPAQFSQSWKILIAGRRG